MPVINKIKATSNGGALVNIGGESKDCYLDIPNAGRMLFYILPEISDSKSAHFNDEPVIGRSFPVKTYSHSDNRTISMKVHFVVWADGDVNTPGSPAYNLKWLRAIQSAVYPEDDKLAPYKPPPICKLRLGDLLGDFDMCAILTQYSVSYPTDCVWDEELKIPYKFEVDTTWHAVYQTSMLPGQQRIVALGW